MFHQKGFTKDDTSTFERAKNRRKLFRKYKHHRLFLVAFSSCSNKRRERDMLSESTRLVVTDVLLIFQIRFGPYRSTSIWQSNVTNLSALKWFLTLFSKSRESLSMSTLPMIRGSEIILPLIYFFIFLLLLISAVTG